MCLPLNFALNRICIAQLTFTCSNQQWKHQDNGWNLFKVNNKDTRTTSTTSLWCLYYWLWKISHIVRLMFSLLTLNKCLLYSRHFFSKISVEHLWQSIQEWNKKNFLKAIVHKFHLVYSWILCPFYEDGCCLLKGAYQFHVGLTKSHETA